MNNLRRLLPLIIACFALSFHGFAADVLTARYSNARTAWNPNEIMLNPSNVNPSSFGFIMNLPVDGQVYAQPLYVSSAQVYSGGQFQGLHNLVIVATEHDSLYAFDADSGALYWQSSMLDSGEVPSDSRNCSDLTPEIGITATPVIDRSAGPHGTIYVVAVSKTPDSSSYFARLHAVDLATGQDILTPVLIQATYPDPEGHFPAQLQDGNGNVFFDPRYERNRAGLVLSNGIIYTCWALIYCEHLGAGWVISYDQKTLNPLYWITADPDGSPITPNADLPNGSGAGIWMSGSAPAVDSAGNLYVSTGNGPFDPTLSTGDFGQSVLKLPLTLTPVSDYFTPFDYPNDEINDLDMASGGTMLLDITDSNNQLHHLLITAAKDSNLYVLNRDSLGQFNAGTNNVYQELPGVLPSGVWGSPAYFNGSVYYGAGNGDFGYGPLQQFQFNANAKLNPVSSQSSEVFICQGGPCVSSSGNTNGIVWACEYFDSAPPVLHAYDALNLGNELYHGSASQSGSVKYALPTVCNGKVFFGTANSVAVFGLFAAPPPPVIKSYTSLPADFSGTGKKDLLWRNTWTGAVSIWLMNGTNIEQNPIIGTPRLNWQILGVGDFNGDGRSDILWANGDTGQLSIWYMNGVSRIGIQNFSLSGVTGTIQAIGDFSGRGRSDLIVRDPQTGIVSYLTNQGAPNFSVSWSGQVAPDWVIVGPANIGGNSTRQLLWRNATTGEVAAWYFSNGVRIQNPIIGSATLNWVIQGAGDVLGNGHDDIIWQNSATGAVSVWAMSGSQRSGIVNPGTAGPSWLLSGTADLNGSGVDRIVWRNVLNGQVWTWQLTGSSFATTPLALTPPVTWVLQPTPGNQ